MVHPLGFLLKKEGERSRADVVDLLNYEKKLERKYLKYLPSLLESSEVGEDEKVESKSSRNLCISVGFMQILLSLRYFVTVDLNKKSLNFKTLYRNIRVK